MCSIVHPDGPVHYVGIVTPTGDVWNVSPRGLYLKKALAEAEALRDLLGRAPGRNDAKLHREFWHDLALQGISPRLCCVEIAADRTDRSGPEFPNGWERILLLRPRCPLRGGVKAGT